MLGRKIRRDVHYGLVIGSIRREELQKKPGIFQRLSGVLDDLWFGFQRVKAEEEQRYLEDVKKMEQGLK